MARIDKSAVRGCWLLILLLQGVSAQAQELQRVAWQPLSRAVDLQVATLKRNLIQLRESFYKTPALAGDQTSVRRALRGTIEGAGFDVEAAGDSFYATLVGALPGPTVVFRMRMDAQSVTPDAPSLKRLRTRARGVRHVRGNDGQMALAISLANLFSKIQDLLPGTIRLILESETSLLSGARPLIEKGALENQPPVEVVIGLEMAPLPSGTFALHAGAVTRAGVSFEIELTEGVALAEVEKILESLPFQSVPEWEPTRFFAEAGKKADPAKKLLYIQFADQSARSILPLIRGRIVSSSVEGIAEARRELELALAGASAHSRLRFLSETIPPVVHDADLVQQIVGYWKEELPLESVLTWQSPVPTLVDDLALYQGDSKVLLVFLGVANPARGIRGIAGESDFDIDPAALQTALSVLAKTALHYMTDRVNSLLE